MIMGAKMEVLPNPCQEEDWWAVIMGAKMEVLPNPCQEEDWWAVIMGAKNGDSTKLLVERRIGGQ